VLVVRVWVDDAAGGRLHIRLLGRTDVTRDEESSTEVRSADDAARHVQDWIESFGRDNAVTPR
jgi:hypothetical protein